jgi:hypothetical protein
MSNIYRGPSKDASYQVSIHLAMWFERRRFLKNRESIRDVTAEFASQIHLVKLDSCFQDLSMLCAKYQSSGIAGSQEEDF